MINSLRGTVAQLGLAQVVIEVGGVGFLVQATPKTLAGLRQGETALLTTTLIVREDSLTLYGFASADELEVFDALLTVSGIGPRLALAVLAVLEPEAVRAAASTGDEKAFTKVPGVGPKVAGRIVLELAGKLQPMQVPAAGAAATAPEWRPQVVAAMISLGWSEKDAQNSIDRATADQEEMLKHGDVGQILRATLSWLGQDGGKKGAGLRAGQRG